EQNGEQRRGGGDDGRVHQRNERLLRGDRILRGGVFFRAKPYIAVVRERGGMREIDRRPREPLRVRLERGRDHPIDRKESDDGPDREHAVAHERRYSPLPRPPHDAGASCAAAACAYMASSDLFSRRSSLIAMSTMTIISSMTM